MGASLLTSLSPISPIFRTKSIFHLGTYLLFITYKNEGDRFGGNVWNWPLPLRPSKSLTLICRSSTCLRFQTQRYEHLSIYRVKVFPFNLCFCRYLPLFAISGIINRCLHYGLFFGCKYAINANLFTYFKSWRIFRRKTHFFEIILACQDFLP